MADGKGGFKSASGYQSLQDSPLARIGYHDKIIMKAWEEDFLPLITNTNMLSRLTECFQVIQFMEEPDVGPWREYCMNQKIVADSVTPGAFTVRICNSAYKALKFDKQDIKMVCERWNDFEKSFLNSAYQGLVSMWRCYVLNAMIMEADVCNKGGHAGIYGDINLGTLGSAIVVTASNFAREIAKLAIALQQRLRWQPGKMFLLLPSAVSALIVDTQFAKANEMGSCCGDPNLLVTGQLPGLIAGFNVIVTDCVPTRHENGNMAYYIIAGHMDAYAFAGDIIQSRLVEPTEYFADEYQMQAIWGGQAIYPDALVIGYWTVSID